MDKTNWDKYYEAPFAASRLTRWVSQRVLLKALKPYISATVPGPIIAELGGANSCFAKVFALELSPSAYHIYDNNANKFATSKSILYTLRRHSWKIRMV